MAAESTVGLRILWIGKDGVLAGYKELTAAAVKMNESIAASAGSSRVAAAGYAEQEAGLVSLGAKMDAYDASLASSAAATDALARVGKVAFLSLTAVTAAWSYESIKWAQSYQSALLQLHTQAGYTVAAMNAVGAAAMANVSKLGTTPNAFITAAYHPASTGMSTKETISITEYAAREAAISGAPLEDTTNSLTGVMKSYNLGASKTAKTIAELNAIVGAGNMHFSDLNSALASGVASTAKTFGVSLTSLGGALAFMTDRGVPAAQAGTRLRMTMSLLGAPSKEASTLLQDAGMTSAQAADSTNAMAQTLYTAGVQPTQLADALRDNSGKGGIYNALALLHNKLTAAGLSSTMQAAMISRSFGGGRMGTTIESMYNNIPGLGQKSTQIEKGSTTAKYMADWTATTKTLSFQLHALGGEVETLGITFGQKLIPPLTKVVELFADTLKWLDKNKEVAFTLAGIITAVLAPAIGVYLYRALFSAGGAIRTVISGYANLITGQSAEDLSLTALDGSLTVSTGAAEGLATADVTLAGAARSAAGAIAMEDLAGAGGGGAGFLGGILDFLGGAGGVVVGVTGTLAALDLAGRHAQSVFNGQKVKAYKSQTALEKKISSLQKQMKASSGGVMGDIESWGPFGWAGKFATAEHIPVLQNNTAGIEARDKVLLSRYQTELKLMKTDNEVEFGTKQLAPAKPSNREITVNLHNHNTVTVDGKVLHKSVTKQTKKVAALSG